VSVRRTVKRGFSWAPDCRLRVPPHVGMEGKRRADVRVTH